MEDYTYSTECIDPFIPSKIEGICKSVIESFTDSEFDPDTVINVMMSRIRSEGDIPRFKILIQINLISNSDYSIRIASKCLWDSYNDNYITFNHTLQNGRIINVMVFGIYFE
jgi:hypothetical protein